MKKLIISLVVIAASMLGVGATSMQAANATTCPYSGCVPTRTTVTTPLIAHPGLVYFRVVVRARSGYVSPRGHVRLVCNGPGRRHVKRVWYKQPRIISMKFYTPGRWHCLAHFSAARKWGSSTGGTAFVLRRRHH